MKYVLSIRKYAKTEYKESQRHFIKRICSENNTVPLNIITLPNIEGIQFSTDRKSKLLPDHIREVSHGRIISQ